MARRMEAATEKITYTLPDGKPLELPAGAPGAAARAAVGARRAQGGAEAEAGSGPGRAKAARGLKVDGMSGDLPAPLPQGGGEVAILTERDPEALELVRH